MAKYFVYQVNDPDNGAIYFHEKQDALEFARKIKAESRRTSVQRIKINTAHFPNPTVLYARLLNRENFADYSQDISKEV